MGLFEFINDVWFLNESFGNEIFEFREIPQ